jgi:hypothetical protein
VKNGSAGFGGVAEETRCYDSRLFKKTNVNKTKPERATMKEIFRN